ncbi:GNAT family N-acetyltransferase [Schumannella sp. 10F1B-5-1]|uniref:GNAT family N-acetyltransferase n=1 Tax=Schumannella sp. 10F1B-5-1 TaxID=2590780 RepID=UPI0011303147|nr:N-acetyltransferase [Schumannella sp. 10F1B-5-1]TPW73417.1 GNAT family N-acetyltransferase [Schumannella sp. 10F1B-5-1]
MPLTIRRAVPADLDAVVAIAHLTFPLACPPDAPAEEIAAHLANVLTREAFAAWLADDDHIILLAELDDADAAAAADDAAPETVGYTMLVAGEPTDADVAAAITVRPTIELSKCYVHPGHHGAGIAHELMAATVTAARESGVAGVWLGVNDENARANRFYGKHGFEVVGRKTFRLGSRVENDYVREKALI